MKTIKSLLLAFAVMCVSVANAQELKKTVLGIENFTYSSSFSEADVEMVRNQIVNAIQKTGRVIVAFTSRVCTGKLPPAAITC